MKCRHRICTCQKSVVVQRPSQSTADGIQHAIAPSRAASTIDDRVWSTNSLRVHLSTESSPSQYQQSVVLQVLDELREMISMDFVLTTDRTMSDVRIGFQFGDGSWSYVGTDATFIPFTESTMNLDIPTSSVNSVVDAETVGTVRHEFGHALGLIHEHQRSDRTYQFKSLDEVVAILNSQGLSFDSDPVVNRQLIQTNILDTFLTGPETEFDENSIMHYVFPCDVYATNPPTVCQNELNVDDPNNVFTTRDIELLVSLYGSAPAPPTDDEKEDDGGGGGGGNETGETNGEDGRPTGTDREEVKDESLSTVSVILIVVGSIAVVIFFLAVVYKYFQQRGPVQK